MLRTAEFAVSLPNPTPGQSAYPSYPSYPSQPGQLQEGESGVVLMEETSERSTPENPREGIFLKLMQVSNPMLDRRYLEMEDDEYQYLLQLRRRLAKQMQDFYPYAAPKTERGGAKNSRKGNARGQVSQSLPSIKGVADSPRKTALKSSREAKARGKSVLFSLPKFS